MEPLDYWRLCDDLTIVQAALLMAGEDPGPSQDNVEGWRADQRPVGYEAAKAAILSAIRRDDVESRIVPLPEYDNDDGRHIGYIKGTVDIKESTVSVASLCAFLAKRGCKEGFFARPDNSAPDYVDSSNQNYAPKLAAAVEAWQAVTSDEKRLEGKTPKQAIEKWLRENASRFGLSDEDGNPNKDGIEQISKVANWKPEGGAAKTKGNLPTPKKAKKNDVI